jgi:hypothetical protein
VHRLDRRDALGGVCRAQAHAAARRCPG